MNRVFKIIGILILSASLIVVAFLFYNHLTEETVNGTNSSVVYNYTEDGKVYTTLNWRWQPIESKLMIEEVSEVTLPTRTIPMHLEENIYVDVEIPDVDVVQDYGKTVWASDGSFILRVLGNVTIDSLPESLGIDEFEVVNDNTIMTPSTKKGSKIIATVVDNYAIVANVYTGNETYSIIKETVENVTSYTVDSTHISDDAKTLDSLPYNGSFAPQISVQNIGLESKQYLFENGSLWLETCLQPLHKAEELYLNKLYKLSNCLIESTYTEHGIFYATAGDYHVCIIAYNTNTCVVLFGSGEEAYANIVYAISYLK